MWEGVVMPRVNLTDKTVFVTGAGSGIGAAIARRCAEYGATVVATDIDEEGVQETAEAIEAAGGTAEAIRVDVQDYDAVESAIETTAEEYGLDGVVNNAGTSHSPGVIESLDDAALDTVFDVNLRGVWNGCRAALPIMKDQGSGSIVNMSSMAGQYGVPQHGVYSLTKAAVISLTQTVALESGAHDVRANAICPSFIDTELIEMFFENTDDPEAAKEQIQARHALQRIGQPEEVADCAAFLLSDQASFVTGHALAADGGISASV